MASKTWILTEDYRYPWGDIGEWSGADDPEVSGDWFVRHRILRGGLSDGVQLVEVGNDRMRAFVVPTRGMGLWKVEVDDKLLGWQSPVLGPVHPAHVSIHDPSGLGWLDGFDEFVVRCGLESNGAPEFDEHGKLTYPLHGKIGNRPAHRVDVTVDDTLGVVTVRGIVDETRFHFQKLRLEASVSVPFDDASVKISDHVENIGGLPAEMQMLYHINVGEPLLSAGDEFIAPIRTIRHRDYPEAELPSDWNRYRSGAAGKSEECFFMELCSDASGQTRVLLKKPAGDCGVTVGYDVAKLPYFTLWKNEVSSQDGFVTGLEPGTNYPNCRSAEKAAGRIVTLPPGGKWSADLEIGYLADGASVEEAERGVASLATLASDEMPDC
ncbi:MAG: DUF4432 family protein [Planctomycetota bacterium]